MKAWLVCLSLLFCAEGFGLSIWTNTIGGSWSTGTNWLGGAPTNNADVRVTNANSKVVIIDSATPAANLSVGRLQLWGPANTTNTLLLTNAGLANPLTASSLTILRGGALIATNSAVVDTGSLTISNGTIALANSAISVPGSSGSFTIGGGATIAMSNSAITVSASGGSFTIGSGGSMRLSESSLTLNSDFQFLNIYGGSLTLDSGSVTVSDSNSVARLGRSTNGNLIINGGTMHVAGDMTLGESFARSVGSVQMTGGSLILDSFLTMAENVGCTGRVFMTGGQLVATNGTNGLLRIGNIGVGQMLLSNATVKATSLSLADGQAPPGSFSTGIVSVASGQLVIAGDPIMDPNFTNIVSIGRYGMGQMTVSNGGTVLLPNTSIARHDKAVGILTVLSNGFVGFSDDVSIGRFSGSTGTVVVAGGQIVASNSPIWVGRDGVGQLNITSGLVQAPSLFVAMVPTNTARGTLNLSGGSALLSSNLVLGDASLSTGKVVMASGSLIITNETSSALLWLSSGNFAFSGGEIIADSVTMTNTGATFTFNKGTLHTKGTTVANGLPFTVGDGTNAATLDLQGGTHSFANGLVISSNATLTGCGTIIGTIENHGTISATNCGPVEKPNITQQPQSQTVTNGGSASFSVTASGTEPLRYQWRHNDADIGGANATSLLLSGVGASSAGNYVVVVTNSAGSVTSMVAVLRVLVSPLMTNLNFAAHTFSASFASENGLNYTLVFKNRFTDPNWQPLENKIGTGGVLQLMDTNALAPSRFYRILVQ